MGMIILLAVGGVLGWLASIILAETDRRAILVDVGAGAAGAALLGQAMTSHSLLSTISPQTLLYGVIGALVAIGIANVVRGTSING